MTLSYDHPSESSGPIDERNVRTGLFAQQEYPLQNAGALLAISALYHGRQLGLMPVSVGLIRARHFPHVLPLIFPA
jgi:hypothetical protein